MTEPTEYQLMKKYLYARKDFDPDLDGTQVNAIIQDSAQDAFDRLCDTDRLHVIEACDTLQKRIDKHSFGDKSAYELLVAVGDALNEFEKVESEE